MLKALFATAACFPKTVTQISTPITTVVYYNECQWGRSLVTGPKVRYIGVPDHRMTQSVKQFRPIFLNLAGEICNSQNAWGLHMRLFFTSGNQPKVELALTYHVQMQSIPLIKH